MRSTQRGSHLHQPAGVSNLVRLYHGLLAALRRIYTAPECMCTYETCHHFAPHEFVCAVHVGERHWTSLNMDPHAYQPFLWSYYTPPRSIALYRRTKRVRWRGANRASNAPVTAASVRHTPKTHYVGVTGKLRTRLRAILSSARAARTACAWMLRGQTCPATK